MLKDKNIKIAAGKVVEELIRTGIKVVVLENMPEYRHIINRLTKMNKEFLNHKW